MTQVFLLFDEKEKNVEVMATYFRVICINLRRVKEETLK